MRILLKSRSKNIFLVYINNEIWGTLPGRVLRFFSILPDQENILDDEKKNELTAEIEKYNWDKLLHFLAYRERSVWECKNFLKQQFLPSSIVKNLMTKAIEKNYVNDERFTEIYVQDLIIKKRNKKQIRVKLMEKHIPENIINSAISKHFDEQTEAEILSANFQKARQRYDSLPAEKRKEKILNYLTAKGFSYSEIKQTMEKVGY